MCNYENYDIFDYWKNKYIDDLEIIPDWYYPHCWGCYNELRYNDKTENINSIWNSIKNTEKCHIIAKQFGGNATPDNLFLLCKKCHKESPDTTEKEIFFKWIYNRRSSHIFGFDYKTKIRDLSDALKSFGLGSESIKNIDFKKIISKTINKIGMHSGEISIDSMIYMAAFEIRKEFDNNIMCRNNKTYENQVSVFELR